MIQAVPSLIDVHSHIVPHDFPAAPATGDAARWPCMQHRHGGQATVLMGSKPFREIDDRSWDVARRVSDMDRDAVTAQVLSPMPELLSYWLERDASIELGRAVNGTIAAMVASRPDRFYGLGMVPMQDPHRAAEELRIVHDKFELSGVEVGSNINGKYLGAADFDPFFAAAEELGMAVFVHALHPVQTAALAGYPQLVPFAGFIADTALCAATLIMHGVLERYPRLRIGFSHGGGVLAPILHRMEHGWGATNGFDGKLKSSPKTYARRFFFDSLVYDRPYLDHLTSQVAPGQVFLGTDYPYLIQQQAPRAFIESAAGGADDPLWQHAALRFLGRA